MKFIKFKNNKFSFFIVIITMCFIVSLIIFNQGVFAQTGTGLEQTADVAGLPKTTGIATIIGQIIYAILGFLGVIFIILLIYGGFIRMTAQGNPEAIKKSNGIITSAIIGIIIILASYTITAFVLNKIGASVGGDGGGGTTGCPGTCVNAGTCPATATDFGQLNCAEGETCCVIMPAL